MAELNHLPTPYSAALLLADGRIFYGYGIGKQGKPALGEICFNTAMTGYQEIMTDPSYSGQLITFTFPHIGNVGTNRQDAEATPALAAGLILRDAITPPSNFRSQSPFDEWLEQNEITGISGVDTRALTRHIRIHGAQNAAIFYPNDPVKDEIYQARSALSKMQGLEGAELAEAASTKDVKHFTTERWCLEQGYKDCPHPTHHVVIVDYGCKENIARCLASLGCRSSWVPATATFDDIRDLKPDGVVLSNGPGDPAATARYTAPMIQKLIKAKIPTMGICLGHQLLALAIGARTEKMHQGHHGANHPIKNLETGQVEITSQNHGFVVAHHSLPKSARVTHVSLFDGTIAGLELEDSPAFSVQYHPESSPGPHDSLYLFDHFLELMRRA